MYDNRGAGTYFTKFSWAKIVRHVPARGSVSIGDPSWTQHWAERQRKRKLERV